MPQASLTPSRSLTLKRYQESGPRLCSFPVMTLMLSAIFEVRAQSMFVSNLCRVHSWLISKAFNAILLMTIDSRYSDDSGTRGQVELNHASLESDALVSR